MAKIFSDYLFSDLTPMTKYEHNKKVLKELKENKDLNDKLEIVKVLQNNYRAEYVINKNETSLTEKELALLADNGNTCLIVGYAVTGNKIIIFRE